MQNDLENKIEAILVFKGEPVSYTRLGEILKANKEDVLVAVSNLKNNLSSRGTVLLERDDEVSLGTAPEHSDMIENLQKEELNKDLSKSSLETLSVILYKNGVNRREIDYIRGVNSSFTLRALSVRGLVERVLDPADSRRYVYKPTFELLSFMGIKSVEELPDYATVLSTLEANKESLDKINEKA